MYYAQLGGSLALEFGNRLAEDKLLRLKDMLQGLEQFLVQGVVLALQVKHWYGHWHRLRRQG
jgi:hypothetical protein